MGRTIGVLSLKGGVGKTSTVVSLGAALADLGKKVLLVDANFSAPNLGFHLNIVNPEKTLHHVMERLANVTDAIYRVGDTHLDVLPASMFHRRNFNYFKLKDRLKTVKNNYDIVLIDSSPALNDETAAAMLASDELLVVTTPDYSTLGTTIKAVKLANRRGTPIIGLVVNKVYGKNFEIPIHDIEKSAGVPVMAVIPHELGVLKAQSEFIPSTLYNPKSAGSIEYKKLASVLVGEKYKGSRWKNLFRLTPPRQDINREIFYHSVFE